MGHLVLVLVEFEGAFPVVDDRRRMMWVWAPSSISRFARVDAIYLLLLWVHAHICCADLTVLSPVRREIAHTNALFGLTRVGARIEGKVYYVGRGCDVGDDSHVPPLATNGGPANAIALADRGDCSFAAKARAAQAVGAIALIVADVETRVPAAPLTVMRAAHSAPDIRIPSVFISHENGMWLRGQVENHGAGSVVAQLKWGVRVKQQHVTMDVWSTSFDPRVVRGQSKTKVHGGTMRSGGIGGGLGTRIPLHGSSSSTSTALDFFEDIRAITSALSARVTFTPRYFIVRGKMWGCDRQPFNAAHPRCGRQCSNSGRYCMFDPDGDVRGGKGRDGIDVLREDLRQLCIAKWSRSAFGDGDLPIWWRYVDLSNRRCSPNGGMQQLISGLTVDFEECSEQAMKDAGVDMSAVRHCVADHGGASMDSGPNSLFEADLRDAALQHVEEVPRLVVNGQMYWGDLSKPCPRPMRVSTCGALAFVCDGFDSSATGRPAQCSDEWWSKKAPAPVESPTPAPLPPTPTPPTPHPTPRLNHLVAMMSGGKAFVDITRHEREQARAESSRIEGERQQRLFEKRQRAQTHASAGPEIVLQRPGGGGSVNCADEVSQCRAASRAIWRHANGQTRDPCVEARAATGSRETRPGQSEAELKAALWWRKNCRATCGLCEYVQNTCPPLHRSIQF